MRKRISWHSPFSSKECMISSDATASSNDKTDISLGACKPMLPSLFNKHNYIKTVDNINLLHLFPDFFSTKSKENLVKSYHCSLNMNDKKSSGKLYVLSSFIFFVDRNRKSLMIVIRLSDVKQFHVISEITLKISVKDKVYLFSEFHRSGSALEFLTNYLSMETKRNTDTDVLPINISKIGRDHDTRFANKLQKSSNGVSYPSLSSSLSSSARSISIDSDPKFTSTPVSRPVISSDALQTSKDANRPHLPRPKSNSDMVVAKQINHFFNSGITTLSDIAFRASCIPLTLFLRLLSGSVQGINKSLRASIQAVEPPKSFTVWIAYVVLIFLSISMAFVYYRIRTLSTDLLTPTCSCQHKIDEVASVIVRLDDTSSRLKRLVESLSDFESTNLKPPIK